MKRTTNLRQLFVSYKCKFVNHEINDSISLEGNSYITVRNVTKSENMNTADIKNFIINEAEESFATNFPDKLGYEMDNFFIISINNIHEFKEKVPESKFSYYVPDFITGIGVISLFIGFATLALDVYKDFLVSDNVSVGIFTLFSIGIIFFGISPIISKFGLKRDIKLNEQKAEEIEFKKTEETNPKEEESSKSI